MTVRHDLVAPEDFKAFLRGFPTGVAVVTTRDGDGEPCGFTCSSLCGLSLDPPLLLVCVHNDSATLAHIRAHGSFAVNLLSQRGQRAAEMFSSPVKNRFATIRWRPTPGMGLPFLIDEAHTVGECRTHAEYTVGDHTILIGALAEVISRSDDLVPLLHGMRRYRAWPG